MTRYTFIGEHIAECPVCGEVDELDAHDCDEEPTFDGVCVMCEERYDSFLEHMKECPGGT